MSKQQVTWQPVRGRDLPAFEAVIPPELAGTVEIDGAIHGSIAVVFHRSDARFSAAAYNHQTDRGLSAIFDTEDAAREACARLLGGDPEVGEPEA